MRLIIVHGWSVTHTDIYGKLPEALAAGADKFGLEFDIAHIRLGRYVSFHDEVTLDDIASALDRALRELPGNEQGIQPFSCITHSSGGPVVRHWIDRHYGAANLAALPLKHLVMLAPANHGSALAVLGKQRIGRMKAFFSGVEPGQRVLDWLSLGSDGQWQLNWNWLDYDFATHGFFPFVLTGQSVDDKFYDFLNSYLVEPGSDGVVRVAGANLNYCYLRLQQGEEVLRQKPMTLSLLPLEQPLRCASPVPLGVYGDYSHSGKKMGIMGSIRESKETPQPLVDDVLCCLQVGDEEGYTEQVATLKLLTEAQQGGEDRYAMLIFNIHDEQGHSFGPDEYDLLLLAGKRYQPHVLPKGFLQDRQMNARTGNLVFYLNADRMDAIKDGLFGFRVTARPTKGFAHYCAAEFRSYGISIHKVLAANQTTYVDVTLQRRVDKNTFRFDSASEARHSFKKLKPDGELS